MAQENTDQPSEPHKSEPTVAELQEKIRAELQVKLESTEDRLDAMKDQKRIWQSISVFLIAVLFCGYYFGSCKSQDYMNRLNEDADVAARADQALQLMCKIVHEKGIIDPICTGLEHPIDANTTAPIGSEVSAPSNKSEVYDFKFMGKSSGSSSEKNVTIEKIIESTEVEENSSDEVDDEVDQTAPVVEEKKQVKKKVEKDFIDLDQQ